MNKFSFFSNCVEIIDIDGNIYPESMFLELLIKRKPEKLANVDFQIWGKKSAKYRVTVERIKNPEMIDCPSCSEGGYSGRCSVCKGAAEIESK